MAPLVQDGPSLGLKVSIRALSEGLTPVPAAVRLRAYELCSVKFSPIATGETKSFAGTRRPLVASGTVGPGLGWGEMRQPYPWQQLQRWEGVPRSLPLSPASPPSRGLLSRTLASATLALPGCRVIFLEHRASWPHLKPCSGPQTPWLAPHSPAPVTSPESHRPHLTTFVSPPSHHALCFVVLPLPGMPTPILLLANLLLSSEAMLKSTCEFSSC